MYRLKNLQQLLHSFHIVHEKSGKSCSGITSSRRPFGHGVRYNLYKCGRPMNFCIFLNELNRQPSNILLLKLACSSAIARKLLLDKHYNFFCKNTAPCTYSITTSGKTFMLYRNLTAPYKLPRALN